MFTLISRRKFSQIEVVESLNVLVSISGKKNKLRIYYLSWLRNKIVQPRDEHDDIVCFSLSLSFSIALIMHFFIQYNRHHTHYGFTSVGDLEHCVHFRLVQVRRMKFLIIGRKIGEPSVEVYAWATKPYSRFMAFKV